MPKDSLVKASQERIFPFGTHFYREPSRSIQELLRDMRVVKRLGSNMLKFQESRSIGEKRDGEIDLDKVGTLVEEAERLWRIC